MDNKVKPMTSPVSRGVVAAFYKALASRDPARIAPFLDDDVEWMIVGPVDLFDFCGLRRGKAAVIDLYQSVIPGVMQVTRFTTDIALVDGDRAATLNRLTGLLRGGDRTISYRTANFVHFRNDKVVEFRAIIDSFDAAEQMLGHPIELAPELVPA
jgi:ketosteroid isomerase-like protein